MHLSESFFSVLPESITPDITKHFIIFRDSAGKKACFSGKRVQLLSYDPSFGENFVEVTESEAKEKHLGKMRCLGTISHESQLLNLFSKYFDFEISDKYTPPAVTTISRESPKKREKREPKKREKKLEIKADQSPQDRDERELVIAYRAASEQKTKDRIFRKILHQRGVNGKTWSQIIKNYVSYNRHHFAQYKDRTVDDFYQDIVTALHWQVAKWFDVSVKVCFSTYAWYVINCAFKRVLQTLGTQKRKVSAMNNIELDDTECAWDESISIEKTQLPQYNFEEDLIKKNLCAHIEGMFELKEITASEELKQEMLEVIRNKSTMQNSLYSLAKKYNVDVDEIFILERDLRENLKNSMIRDILIHMQYDINADEDIATKYKRSKGHVIKMKRHLITTVKSKLKG